MNERTDNVAVDEEGMTLDDVLSNNTPAVDYLCKTELIMALVKAKSQFGEVKKTKKNPAYGSKYADMDAINSAVDPALHENGLVILQPVEERHGSLYVHTLLLHESGQHLESWFPISEDTSGKKTELQQKGAGVTYIRRYAKSAILDLAAEDDVDGNASATGRQSNESKGRDSGKPPKTGGTIAQGRGVAYGLAKAYGMPDHELKEACKRFYNKKHAGKKEFTTRGEGGDWSAKDWSEFNEQCAGGGITDYQFDVLSAQVKGLHDVGGDADSVEHPKFLEWVTKSLDKNVSDIRNISRAQAAGLIGTLINQVKTQKATVAMPPNPNDQKELDV